MGVASPFSWPCACRQAAAIIFGLGVTRTLASVVTSFGRGPVRPHASVGFEYWSKSLDVRSAAVRVVGFPAAPAHTTAASRSRRRQKLTLLVDFLGQRIMSGGPAELGR